MAFLIESYYLCFDVLLKRVRVVSRGNFSDSHLNHWNVYNSLSLDKYTHG